jgi:hypothetical protein
MLNRQITERFQRKLCSAEKQVAHQNGLVPDLASHGLVFYLLEAHWLLSLINLI